MKSDVDYARSEGPPADWRRLAVFDAAGGHKLRGVIEANAAEGWFIRYVFGPDGRVLRDGENMVTERVEADILIQRTFGCGAPIRPPEGWTPSNHIAAGYPDMDHAREPLRFTPPNERTGDKPPPVPSPPTPPPSASHRPRTPEDGQRIHTPEGGKPITTRGG